MKLERTSSNRETVAISVYFDRNMENYCFWLFCVVDVLFFTILHYLQDGELNVICSPCQLCVDERIMRMLKLTYVMLLFSTPFN